MGNKAWIALCLALLLLIAGGFLPKLVGTLMDASGSNKMEFAQVSDIQLEFVQSDMAMEEILGILCKATHNVEVPTDLAVHTSSEIQQLSAQALSHYQQAGFFSHSIDATAQLESCVPVLVYEQSSRRKSNIFWNLSYRPADSSWALGLEVDDQTGAVCSISYTRTEEDTANPSEPLFEDPESMLAVFSQLFLDGLGEGFPQSGDGTLSFSTDQELAAATLTWPDTIHGDCHLIFYILDNAFYTITY